MTLQADGVVSSTLATWTLFRLILYSSLPLRTKIGVYKTYLRSKLTNAAPAWYALFSAIDRKSLQV